MPNAVAYLDESAASWERSLYAFLAEKQRRSGSMRTVVGYSRMLNDFFGRSGKTPDQVTSPDAFAWAYGIGLSGREPSSVTIGARLACLSSFFRFMIRMKVLTSNPCEAIGAPSRPTGCCARTEWRADPSAPGRCSRNARRPARPRDHPNADLHWPAPSRSTRHDSRQHLR